MRQRRPFPCRASSFLLHVPKSGRFEVCGRIRRAHVCDKPAETKLLRTDPIARILSLSAATATGLPPSRPRWSGDNARAARDVSIGLPSRSKKKPGISPAPRSSPTLRTSAASIVGQAVRCASAPALPTTPIIRSGDAANANTSPQPRCDGSASRRSTEWIKNGAGVKWTAAARRLPRCPKPIAPPCEFSTSRCGDPARRRPTRSAAGRARAGLPSPGSGPARIGSRSAPQAPPVPPHRRGSTDSAADAFAEGEVLIAAADGDDGLAERLAFGARDRPIGSTNERLVHERGRIDTYVAQSIAPHFGASNEASGGASRGTLPDRSYYLSVNGAM